MCQFLKGTNVDFCHFWINVLSPFLAINEVLSVFGKNC